MLGRRHVAAILLTINGTRAAPAQVHAAVRIGLTWGRGPATQPALSLPEPTARSPEQPKTDATRNVVVLLHIATRNPSSALLDSADVDSLLVMVRAIAYQRGIRVISLCAFNLDQEKVLFDQRISGEVDLAGLQSGIRSFKPGTIDYSLLAARSSGTGPFLDELVARGNSQRPDAVIILGSQTSRSTKLRKIDLRGPATDRPLFYLRYAPSAGLNLWNDAIHDLVHAKKGGLYDVRQPADFWRAWTAIESTLGLGSNR